MTGTMKAATWRPGSHMMETVETARPNPAKGEILVQIKVAGINEMDVETRKGGWAKQVKQFRKSGPVVTGFEFAGVAVSDGKDIKAGTPVFGYSPVLNGPRVHAEYAAVPESCLAPVPDRLGMADAAALIVMGLTAIEVIDDIAGIGAEDTVCVLGAAGGLGAYATQLANARGAAVTAIASETNRDFVLAQGATVFRSRSEEPFRADDRFSLILDCPAKLSFAHSRKHLRPGGHYVSSNPLNDLSGFARAAFSRRRAGWLLMLSTTPEKINRLSHVTKAGDMRAVIDSIYEFGDINEALDRFATPGKQGRVLINVGSEA